MVELDTRIEVRTNSQLKEQATRILDRMGIDMPTAINMFLSQIVHDQRLPFQPSLPPTPMRSARQRRNRLSRSETSTS